MTKPLETELGPRFWAFVRKDPAHPTGCWEWTGARHKKGYGQFSWNGRKVEAYRLAYLKLVGPIPPGFHVDHLCNNPPCVRPDHLEAVTPQENNRRKHSRGDVQRITDVVARRNPSTAPLSESQQARESKTHTVQPVSVTSDVPPAVLKLAEDIPFCPWKPSERQKAFLLDFSREAFYGGSAGGGKSIALLMAALQFVHVPHYGALIIRRTYADLAQPRAVMDIAHIWLDPFIKSGEVKWNEKTATWTFRNGAKLKFGYLANSGHRLQYQSAAYQFVGWDELTHFPYEEDYEYLFSRCRRPDGDAEPMLARVPLRVRSASNPGGPGHKWVRKRFVIDGGRNGRNYYPATLEDNPFIDQKEYDKALSMLKPHERAQLRWGDWFVAPPGSIFNREWFEIDNELPEGRWDWVRYWKLQPPPKENEEPDYLAGALVGYRATDQLFLVKDITTLRSLPADHDALMKQRAESDDRTVNWYVEKEHGESGDDVRRHLRKLLAPRKFRSKPSSGDLTMRAELVSSLAQNGHVRIMNDTDWFDTFIEEGELFPNGPTSSQVHALSGAIAALVRRNKLSGFGRAHSTEQENSWAGL